jgi:RND family efflux transporter MFP subunit
MLSREKREHYMNWVKANPRRFAVWLVVAVAVFGILSRLESRNMLHRASEHSAIPTVAVTKAATGPRTQELVLPGTVQAYVSAPIYARTAGYLRKWYVDIGAEVKAGDLLAEVDAPEVEQQLRQAEADAHTAEANEKLAQSTAERWQALLQAQTASKQAADEKAGDYAAKKAAAASAQANLRRLREMQGFTRIIAPFDGTITERNIDIGQLVTNGGGRALFNISDLRKLRVYVQVPQTYAPSTQVGLPAELVFAERPNQKYPATIVRTADALDAASRTLRVELEVDNALRELFPGSYTEVQFQMPASATTVRIPANALLFRSAGPQVATLGAGNRIMLKPVTIGRDFGTELEILTGLAANERIVINPPDSLETGVEVRVLQNPGQDAGAETASAGDKK